ncbi:MULTISPECIES: thiol peroxidase [unclassified Lactobacillus]|uniref:thiol peroxidase n=1 Tax=unclassified Lactobacillus TaxID=2620435 RepID=UPI000EFD2EBE|nr:MULTISPECIES: thiol peroxidase [unclassified Lactobacillus]RMC24367.1 thiol peroxidase [Lactobacillus sp. ESL0247]RMC28506.1 thiol peroxidase [Lactobacillus sp. ESL0246]RMC31697.1 thiol peroxidase [Lactobacillus sp. ESL0245]RMC48851.1 thiol peroxidase [Lactobacillus sp. ESL0228]
MQITRNNTPLATNGQPPLVGTTLPDFQVERADKTNATSFDLITKPTLISVVPNINTSVCSISTKHFNSEVDTYEGINFYTISTNTLDDQKNWCAAEGVEKMELLSDNQRDFGKKMGLYIEEMDVDSRSIWIVDVNKKILYQELVHEMTDEPNYDAALEFLDGLK